MKNKSKRRKINENKNEKMNEKEKKNEWKRKEEKKKNEQKSKINLMMKEYFSKNQYFASNLSTFIYSNFIFFNRIGGRAGKIFFHNFSLWNSEIIHFQNRNLFKITNILFVIIFPNRHAISSQFHPPCYPSSRLLSSLSVSLSKFYHLHFKKIIFGYLLIFWFCLLLRN